MKTPILLSTLFLAGTLFAQSGVYKIEGNLEVTGSSALLGPVSVGDGSQAGKLITLRHNDTIGGDWGANPSKFDLGAMVIEHPQHGKLALDSNQVMGSINLHLGAVNDLAIWAGGNHRMTVKHDGNIGVGTDDPKFNVHLRNGIQSTLQIEAATFANYNGARVALKAPSNNSEVGATYIGHHTGVSSLNYENPQFVIQQIRVDGSYARNILEYKYYNEFWRFRPGGITVLDVKTAEIKAHQVMNAVNGLSVTNGLTADSITLDGVAITEWPEKHVDGDGNLSVAGTIEADKGVVLNDTAEAQAGAIRWTGTEFEGYDGTAWVTLSNREVKGDISMGVFN